MKRRCIGGCFQPRVLQGGARRVLSRVQLMQTGVSISLNRALLHQMRRNS
jgi:hypothetical protein